MREKEKQVILLDNIVVFNIGFEIRWSAKHTIQVWDSVGIRHLFQFQLFQKREREIIRNNYQLQESEMDLLKTFDGSTFGEIEEVIKRFSIDSAFRIS